MKVLTSVRLTTNQKRVLAKIAAAPTPKVAGREITDDRNLSGATRDLERLGLIEFVAGEAMMTEKGKQLARDENIIGDDDALTSDGEQLAYTDSRGKQDKDLTKQPPQTPPPGLGGVAPTPPPGLGGVAPTPPPGLGGVAPLGGPPGGVGAPPGAGLFMSDTPYQSMELLQELLILKEGRKIRRPGWGKPQRRRMQQFMKSQQKKDTTKKTFSSTQEPKKYTVPHSFKRYLDI